MIETLDMQLSNSGFSRRSGEFDSLGEAVDFVKKTVAILHGKPYYDELYIGPAKLLGLKDILPEKFVVYIRNDTQRERK